MSALSAANATLPWVGPRQGEPGLLPVACLLISQKTLKLHIYNLETSQNDVFDWFVWLQKDATTDLLWPIHSIRFNSNQVNEIPYHGNDTDAPCTAATDKTLEIEEQIFPPPSPGIINTFKNGQLN